MTTLQAAIAKIYWRNIKKGEREFTSIKDKVVQAEVKRLATVDVESGEITAEEYKQYIGEDYVAAE